jgi:hypothetical protein
MQPTGLSAAQIGGLTRFQVGIAAEALSRIMICSGYSCRGVLYKHLLAAKAFQETEGG